MPTSRLLSLSLALLLTSIALAQQGPPPEVRAAIQSFERMLESHGDEPLRKFAAERLAPSFRSSLEPEALLAHLRTMREAVGGNIGAVSVERVPDGLRLEISGSREAAFRLQLDASGLFTRLDLLEAATAPAPSPEETMWAATTWESLASDLRKAETAGFRGVFVARRGGKEVVRSTYGPPTKLATVYCIGSTPIDFTRTGIRILERRGKLTLDDPVTRFFPDTPADKRAITLRHLMSGKSGLSNFHHVPGKDWDYDLAWIDRDTAVKRILAMPLLFPPGSGQAHSHSAFGLLAAVIEIASGSSYPGFVRAEILEPLGMKRTGFYGETLGLPAPEFAIGHGESSAGLPNIPPNWGPTSWLVMGSGGMVSTLPDMERYYAAHQDGEEVAVGGSDRGFFLYHATNGTGNEALFLMNGEGRAPAIRAMTKALGRLVLGR